MSVAYLDDIEKYRGNDQLDVDAVFRPGIDTFFRQQRMTIWSWEDKQKNPILFHKEKDKANSPPTTPVSERPNTPLVLLTSLPLQSRIKKVPDYVY